MLPSVRTCRPSHVVDSRTRFLTQLPQMVRGLIVNSLDLLKTTGQGCWVPTGGRAHHCLL